MTTSENDSSESLEPEEFGVYYCALCQKPIINGPDDRDTWKEVRGWVGGPKKDSMRLRENTGRLAHDECVRLLQAGQAVDQPTLFGSESLTVQKWGKAALPEVFTDPEAHGGSFVRIPREESDDLPDPNIPF